MRMIDADAVFELFKPFKDALDDEKVKSAYIQTLTLIHNAPSIEPKRGEWIEFDTKWGRSFYYCTNCMETSEVPTAFGKPLYDFCPNCGARMKGADDE